MTEKNILIFEKSQSPWAAFLTEYFEDTATRLVVCQEKAEALSAFTKYPPAMIFLNPDFLSLPFVQKIKVRKQTDPFFRVYMIGAEKHGKTEPFVDAVFPSHPVAGEFTRKWVETLPMPETVRLLLIDDEEEIAGMVRDYFEGRKTPTFKVLYAPDGQKGLDAVVREKPDLVLLDIKMPVMDGREFYVELRKRKIEVPVIVFFDSVSGEELAEIRKYGNPPAVEKGTITGSLSSLMQLVGKTIYLDCST